MTNSWEGDQTILRIQRLLKKNKLKDTSTKEVTNQRIRKTNWTQEDIMKRSTKCSKNQEGAPQGTCTM